VPASISGRMRVVERCLNPSRPLQPSRNQRAGPVHEAEKQCLGGERTCLAWGQGVDRVSFLPAFSIACVSSQLSVPARDVQIFLRRTVL
jgi:hypothetical protein